MDLKEFGLYFANQREKSGYDSQRQLAIVSGVSNGTIARIEGGTQKVSPETLKKLAPFLRETNYVDLLEKAGYIDTKKSSEKNVLTEKNERDIAKRMEKIKQDLKNADGLSFMGEPMSDEAIESLLEAIEYAERQTTRINKKYIPKKYRDK